MLIDTGSELTFIADTLVKQLKLHREPSLIPIIGIGGTHSGHTRGAVSISLRSIYDDRTVLIKTHILTKLMPSLPSFSPSPRTLAHLQGLPLADPELLTPGPVELILGADIYGQIIREQIKRGPPGTPIAQNTIFGWIVLGPWDASRHFSGFGLCAVGDSGYQALQDLLTQFWVQEEVAATGREPNLTPDEQECENHFSSTHTLGTPGVGTSSDCRSNPFREYWEPRTNPHQRASVDSNASSIGIRVTKGFTMPFWGSTSRSGTWCGFRRVGNQRGRCITCRITGY